ncbi:MAG TPA: response regulator [Candidatus Dormibacteraeota bacterium]
MPAGLSEVDMQTYVDGLDRFLSDHHNEVVLALALLVLAEAVIIWLWARRAATLRHRLDAAGEAAGSSAAHAAAALAVDAFRPAEREPEPAAAQQVLHTPAASAPDPAPHTVPAPALAMPPAPAAAPQPARYTPPAPAPAPAPQPVLAPPQPTRYTPAALQPSAPAAPDLHAAPTASVSPVEIATALRAAASQTQPQPTTTAVAAWAVEAADQLPPTPVEERLAALGTVAAWTETAPVAGATAAWSWTSPESAPAGDPEPAAAVLLLLVEDDVNVAKLYRMLLESRGYTVRHAADGVEGLDAARRERPDLILLDVMMPRMNGISFLQALRDDPTLGAVPAVVLSNFREPRLVERAMALGALEYMVKAQTRPETLIGAIPHWLKGERVVTA